MQHVAITIESLGKRYRYGGVAPLSHNLRADIMDWAKGLFRRNGPHPTLHQVHDHHIEESPEYFWALKNINLDINQGEVVGLIGRNGAGKSTLLKILSRITPPTAGKVTYRGRVASLLEVGTGFSRELTGRENIFLNGSILGMRRTEISRKLDAIVAFAEVEKFLDTPVKFYSSGMYVRLAFAVAAHLETDILLVDEVLAVGDGAFQRKCMGKMGEIAKGGRTVLFVSHNMDAIRKLCSRVVVIDRGTVSHDSTPESALRVYAQLLREPRELGDVGLKDRLERTTGAARITNVTAQGADSAERWEFKTGETVRLKLDYRISRPVPSLGLYVALTTNAGSEIITTIKSPLFERGLSEGEAGTAVVEFPTESIRPGEYSLYLWLGDRTCETGFDVLDHNVGLSTLTIVSDEKDPHRRAGYFNLPARVSVHENRS